MKVFLDKNVLVSAFSTRGLCADLLRTAMAKHELILAEVVLIETERVLAKKFKVPEETILEILALLKSFHVVPKPEQAVGINIRDKDDVWVLTSALAGNADVLITGDQDLLSLAEIPDIIITDPRGFWDMVKTT